jgi:hypothetical protein
MEDIMLEHVQRKTEKRRRGRRRRRRRRRNYFIHSIKDQMYLHLHSNSVIFSWEQV